jgi:hypothetical protein
VQIIDSFDFVYIVIVVVKKSKVHIDTIQIINYI